MAIRYLTKDGNFILYEYKGNERKKLYIYDIYKKEDFELTLDNVNKYLANHPEKEILLSPITEYPFFNGIKRRGVDIQKISDNGQVFIGQLNRDLSKKNLHDRSYPKVAFITTKAGPIQEISLSEFGSTKLVDISADGNYSVGWGDVWYNRYVVKLPTRTKISSGIFSQALLYDLSNNKLINIGNLSSNNTEYNFRNARALDITADGKYVVGWSETDEYNLNTIPENRTGNGPRAFIIFHRHGFIYFDNHMYDLGTLNNGKDSEAHAITDDGRIIYGVATNERNSWRQVIWRNDKIDDKYFNTEQQEIADEKDKQAEQEAQLAKEQVEKAKAEQEAQLAKERAEKAKAEQEAQLAKERAEKAKAEQEAQLAKEQAEKAKAEQEAQLAKEQAEKAKAEQEAQLAKERAEKAKAEQEAQLAKEQAEKAKAEQEAQLAKEQAEKAKAEQEAQLAKEQAEKAKAEQEAQLAKERAEKAKAEQEAQLAKEQAEKAKAEQEAQLAKERAEKAKAEQEAQLAKEQAEKAKAEQEAQLAKEQAEKAKAEQEAQLAKERAEKAKAEQEAQLAKEQAEKAKADAKEKDQESTRSSTAISKPIDIENTEQAIQLAAENGYKFIDMQQGQLRYLASATCSVGMEKACLSGFTHYQNIDKANAIQTGISGAYRFDINQTPLVVGLAIDSDSYSSLPKGYEYQGYPLPLIGFSVNLIPSLNPALNGNALHLSLKGAYLNRKITIERPTLSNTEAGKGQARISGYYIDFQGYYPYTLNSLITVTPFAGLTFNQTSRSAYSETQGAKFAAHYQSLTAHSLLAKIGLGIEYVANAKLKLDTKAGLLWHLSHHQDDFQSHIDYIGQQKINYNENKKQLAQRPFASVGLTYQLDKQSSVNTTTNWQMTSYRNHDIHMGIAYTYRF
ncbi:autotransporter domain-containing protein [Proteus mirabilis]|uniref:autotransporter domain-containing protein n=3 Tax=Proteus mirabilis TaxID=584 RepID=UPI0020B76AF2|nr:autotransporter domain-containing protein [Proteus mirabilis]